MSDCQHLLMQILKTCDFDLCICKYLHWKSCSRISHLWNHQLTVLPSYHVSQPWHRKYKTSQRNTWPWTSRAGCAKHFNLSCVCDARIGKLHNRNFAYTPGRVYLVGQLRASLIFLWNMHQTGKHCTGNFPFSCANCQGRITAEFLTLLRFLLKVFFGKDMSSSKKRNYITLHDNCSRSPHAICHIIKKRKIAEILLRSVYLTFSVWSFNTVIES